MPYSSQINFFLMPEEAVEIIRHIQQQERATILIDSVESDSPEPIIVQDIDTCLQVEGFNKRYLLKESWVEYIQYYYIKSRNKYVVFDLNSLLLEVTLPVLLRSESSLRAGRIFYAIKHASDAGVEAPVLKEFSVWANGIMKKIRGSLYPSPFKEYKGWYMSQQVIALATEGSLKLRVMGG